MFRAFTRAGRAEISEERAGVAMRALEVALSGLRSFVGFFSRRSKAGLIHRVRGWVAICLNLRASAIRSLEIRFYQKAGQGSEGLKELDPAHPLIQLFENPYPEMPWWDGNEIIGRCTTDRAVFGASIVYTPTGAVPRGWKGGRMDWKGGTPPMPTRMLVIPEPIIKPVPPEDPRTDERPISHWELTTPNGVERIPVEEICYMPRLGPSESLSASLVNGRSILQEMEYEISVTESSAEFLSNSFIAGGVPPMVIESELGAEKMGDDSLKAWTKKWLERFQGRNAAAPLGILPPGFHIKEVNLTANIVAMLGMSSQLQESIANAFGVPPGYLRKNASNYATALVEDYRFRVNEIEPEAYAILRHLTRHFRRFQKKGEAPFVIQHVPFIYEDQAEIRAQEAHDLANGIITRDDARAKRGMAKIPGGSVATVTAGSALIPVSQIGATSSIPTQKVILQQGDSQ